MISESNTVVVGTGAAALATTWKLLQLGIEPVVIDCGAAVQNQNYDLEFPSTSQSRGVAKKTYFGDDSMYLYPSELISSYDDCDGIPLSSSFGGLTTVWGSNIQVYSGQELSQWGFDGNKLAQEYKWLLEKIPHVGRNDNLTARFPWPITFDANHPISSRFCHILESLDRSDSQFHYGYSRNATSSPKNGCVLCGECLSGCPENVIFNSKTVFRQLQQQAKIRIIAGLVTKLEVDESQTKICYLDKDKKNNYLYASRVYVAAGSIATSVILQNSGLIPSAVTLDDTQVLYIPFITTRRPSKTTQTYSLAQLFLTANASDAELGNDFHISMYESDASWRDRITNIIGPLSKIVPKFVLQRLIGGIGFLPAHASGKILIISKSDGTQVRLELPCKKLVKQHVKKMMRQIRYPLLKSQLLPIRAVVQIPKTGASYHVGVLRDNSGSHLVNPKGQLCHDIPIYICDGASLPSLPTGPVTLTIMANAAYIVNESFNHE